MAALALLDAAYHVLCVVVIYLPTSIYLPLFITIKKNSILSLKPSFNDICFVWGLCTSLVRSVMYFKLYICLPEGLFYLS